MFELRRATIKDMLLCYEWANDETVRSNSINTGKIDLDDHKKWFQEKLKDDHTIFLIFSEGTKNIGQMRIDVDTKTKQSTINYSIGKQSRGKGYGTKILVKTLEYYQQYNSYPLVGFVKRSNNASISAFQKAGFNKNEDFVLINEEQYIRFSIGEDL